jgi:hypothetical protein
MTPFHLQLLFLNKLLANNTFRDLTKSFFITLSLKAVCKIFSRNLSYDLWDFKFSRRRIWRLQPSWIHRRVVSMKNTDVSDVRNSFSMTMNIPDDWGSTHLRNYGLHQREYTALYPTRLSTWTTLGVIGYWQRLHPVSARQWFRRDEATWPALFLSDRTTIHTSTCSRSIIYYLLNWSNSDMPSLLTVSALFPIRCI